MKTRAEYLPIELWICIFNYLEIHDLYQAFSNLNNYFNDILSSNHLLFHVRLKDNDKNPNLLSSTLFESNRVCNRIIYIEGITQGYNQYIPRFLHTNVDKFIRLHSLNIKIRLNQEYLICLTLEKLSSLKYLSMECIMTQTIVETILNIKSLRICKLIYRNIVKIHNYYSDKQSNIEILYVKDYYDHRSITNIFLAHMPKLKILEISGSTYILNYIELWFTYNSYFLEKLQTIKIKCSIGDPTMTFFEQLYSAMSIVKNLYIDIGPSRWDEDILYILIYYSWPIIEQIQRTHLSIRGYIYIDPTNNNLREKLDNYKEILLSKNNQINNCFKIQWTEKYLALSTIIDVTIIKS